MYLTLAGRVCGQAIAVKRLRPTSIMPATRGGPPDHGLTGRHHRLDGGTVIARHKIRPRKLHPSHHRRTIRWSLRPRPPSSRRAKRRGSQADVDVHLARANFPRRRARPRRPWARDHLHLLHCCVAAAPASTASTSCADARRWRLAQTRPDCSCRLNSFVPGRSRAFQSS